MGRQYKKLSDFENAMPFVTGAPPPAFGLTEESLRGRVMMLNRMRRTLIEDWHPIIDVLLTDYTKEVKRLEALRYPPDEPDEPDVLDRDFEGA